MIDTRDPQNRHADGEQSKSDNKSKRDLRQQPMYVEFGRRSALNPLRTGNVSREHKQRQHGPSDCIRKMFAKQRLDRSNDEDNGKQIQSAKADFFPSLPQNASTLGLYAQR